MRVEREELKDEGDVAIARLQVLDRLVVDEDIALVDRLQPGDGAQRRRLAAAGRAEQHDEFLVGDGEVELPDDIVVTEILLDVVEGGFLPWDSRSAFPSVGLILENTLKPISPRG